MMTAYDLYEARNRYTVQADRKITCVSGNHRQLCQKPREAERFCDLEGTSLLFEWDPDGTPRSANDGALG